VKTILRVSRRTDEQSVIDAAEAHEKALNNVSKHLFEIRREKRFADEISKDRIKLYGTFVGLQLVLDEEIRKRMSKEYDPKAISIDVEPE